MWPIVAAAVLAKDICSPAPQYPNGVSGRSVELKPLGLNLDRWNGQMRRYVPQGLVTAQALHDKEFTAMLHGPKVRGADVRSRDRSGDPKEFAESLPPVYFTGTLADKLFLIDSINATAAPLGSGLIGPTWRAELKMLGYTIAPSTLYPVDDNDELQGLLIAGGNPFVLDPGNHSMQASLGGITYMKNGGCTKLWPVFPSPYSMTGRVINTIDCHKKTGMCFFSAWKFDGMGKKRAPFPDCLWYCRPDDLSNPKRCTKVGVVKDEHGHEICRDYGLGGGVHGLTIMRDDPDDPNTFDLLLIFTGGVGYDKGTSWMSMLKVSVSERDFTIRDQRLWGASLWNDTVAKPHDAGCDHAMLDESGYVWVTSFRQGNAGIHMLNYSGELMYTVHGFTEYTPGQYSYPAGLSGYGSLFQSNSLIALATSAQKGGVPLLGTATLFLVDVSKLITERVANSSTPALTA